MTFHLWLITHNISKTTARILISKLKWCSISFALKPFFIIFCENSMSISFLIEIHTSTPFKLSWDWKISETWRKNTISINGKTIYNPRTPFSKWQYFSINIDNFYWSNLNRCACESCTNFICEISEKVTTSVWVMNFVFSFFLSKDVWINFFQRKNCL